MSKIFVGGLSWETTDTAFIKFFSKFGEISDSIVMKDRTTGRSRGFGFITFASPDAVRKVMAEKGGLELDGRKIECKVAVPREKMGAGPTGKTKKIFAGGLSPEVTEAEFRQYFENFGTVQDAVIMVDSTTGTSRGFGFVTFESEDVVDTVCAKDHTIKSRRVECKPAVPKSQMNRDRSGGWGSGGGGGPPRGGGWGGHGGRGGYGPPPHRGGYGGPPHGDYGRGPPAGYGGYGNDYGPPGGYGGYSGGHGYGQPPPEGAGGYGGGYGAPPPAGGGYGAPPPAGGYGAPPPAGGGYGAPPPAGGGYGAPPPAGGGYGAPAPAQGYGAPPPAQNYGARGAYGGAPPTAAGGYDQSTPAVAAAAPTPGYSSYQQPGAAYGAQRTEKPNRGYRPY